jgi:hypothetical protein
MQDAYASQIVNALKAISGTLDRQLGEIVGQLGRIDAKLNQLLLAQQQRK